MEIENGECDVTMHRNRYSALSVLSEMKINIIVTRIPTKKEEVDRHCSLFGLKGRYVPKNE